MFGVAREKRGIMKIKLPAISFDLIFENIRL